MQFCNSKCWKADNQVLIRKYSWDKVTQSHFCYLLYHIVPLSLPSSLPPSLPPFQMFTDADSALDSANSTASDALETTMQHSPIINRISLQSSANEMQLTDLNVSIGSLRQQLQEAMQAAASVSC